MAAQRITLLIEDALTEADAARLTQVHSGDDVAYRVLVPAEVKRNLLADVVDHLSLLELREALLAVRGHDEGPDQAEAEAELAASLSALSSAGAEATGEVIEGDPIVAVKADVEAGATEVFVVTRPHAVEDTLHTDWASRAREELGVPVLHVYAGSSFLG